MIFPRFEILVLTFEQPTLHFIVLLLNTFHVILNFQVFTSLYSIAMNRIRMINDVLVFNYFIFRNNFLFFLRAKDSM